MREMLSYRFKDEPIKMTDIRFVKKVDDKMIFISCYNGISKEKVYNSKEERDKVFEQYKKFVNLLKNTWQTKLNVL